MVTSSSMQATHTSVRYGKQAAAHVNTTPKAQGRIPCQQAVTTGAPNVQTKPFIDQ